MHYCNQKSSHRNGGLTSNRSKPVRDLTREKSPYSVDHLFINYSRPDFQLILRNFKIENFQVQIAEVNNVLRSLYELYRSVQLKVRNRSNLRGFLPLFLFLYFHFFLKFSSKTNLQPRLNLIEKVMFKEILKLTYSKIEDLFLKK